MLIKNILFLIFALISTVAAALTITFKNPVHSAISMIACLISIAAVYFIMGAHFVGAIQILVYAGAIMVLFLFIIMLLEKRDVETVDKAHAMKAINLFLISMLLISVLLGLAISFSGAASVSSNASEAFGTIRAVGAAIFTKYVFAFEMLSILILVAIAGVMTLSAKDGDR